MCRVKNCFRLPKVGGRRGELPHQVEQLVDFTNQVELRLPGGHCCRIVREVLELARRVEGLEGFEEGFEVPQTCPPLSLLRCGEDGLPPDHQVSDPRCGSDGPVQLLGDLLLDLGYGILSGRRIHDEPLRHPEEVAEVLQRSERQVLGPFHMLELSDITDGELG
jgi:hypothetical protein